VATCAITVWSASGQVPLREPHNFLKNHVGFADPDLKNMERGRVVTKVLETGVQTEVAVFGVVWMNARIQDFVQWQNDIERFEHGDAVLAIQKISDPPKLADFESLALPAKDLNAIPKCRVGKCEVKIDEPALTRLHQEVVWSAPDAHHQANRLIRQMMLEATEEYLKNGDHLLGAYRDKKRPLFLEKEFDGLLENSPFLIEYSPEFHRFLDDYPNVDLPNAQDFLYWSKVQFGLRPTIRMNHVVIYDFGRDKNVAVAVGSKMLYASHYFHTALELKFLVKDTTRPDAEGFYLMILNRSRSDGLTGLFGGIVRSKAQSGAEKGLASALDSAREVLEGSYETASSR
jgi:hypothetical protein